jgi:hypothetical protein
MDSAHGHFVTRMAAGPSTGQIIGPEHSGVHKQLGSAFWPEGFTRLTLT